MKPLLISTVLCACALGITGFPNRLKRETTSVVASTASSDASAVSSTEPETSSSTTSLPPLKTSQDSEFGFGASAGIGGLRSGVGVGNFNPNPKSDVFEPWGAYAGINLGSGGRIGAGCSGLNCGVQLGHFVLGTPHLLGIGRNLLNPRQQNGDLPEGKKGIEVREATETGGEFNPNSDDFRLVFRNAFRGFRETLQSFFRAPVTHFIKKHVHIDNSTESVVGPVKSAASEPKTYRIQLSPGSSAVPINSEKDPQENELE